MHRSDSSCFIIIWLPYSTHKFKKENENCVKWVAWNSKFCGKLSSVINAHLAFQWRFHVISSVGGGRRKIGLLPEIGKIIVERVSNRPGVYTFRDAVEIQETICNKIIKKSIFDWHFYQNLKGFLQISKVSSFFCLAVLSSFAVSDGKNSPNIDYREFLYKILHTSIFWKDFKKFHLVSNSSPGSKIILLIFNKFLKKVIALIRNFSGLIWWLQKK